MFRPLSTGKPFERQITLSSLFICAFVYRYKGNVIDVPPFSCPRPTSDYYLL